MKSTALTFYSFFLQKIKSKLYHFLLYTLALFSAVSATIMIIAGLFASPIADDYAYFYNNTNKSPFSYTAEHYTTHNGRWGQAFFVASSHAIFDEKVVKIYPVIALLTLFVSISALLYLLLPFKPKSTAVAMLLSSLFLAGYLWSLPSVFDSLYWFTSSSVYLNAVISFTLISVLYVILQRYFRTSWLGVLLFAMFVFIVSAFNETATLLITGSFALLAVYTLLQRNKIKHNILLPVTGFAASSLSFLTMYFAPGTVERRSQSQADSELATLLTTPIKDLEVILPSIWSWRLITFLLIGFIISKYFISPSKKSMLILFLLGISFTILPLYINSVITHYGVGGTPLRSYTVPLFFTYTGVSLLFALLFYAIRKHTLRHLVVYSAGGTCLAIISIICLVIQALPLVQAQALRNAAIESRDDYVINQRDQNDAVIDILPAPNLLIKSEAVDFAFNTNQTDWYIDYYKKYYRIENRQINILTNQPESYCLADQAPSWFGVYICDDVQY